jgi:hypothetical protein
MLELPRSTVSAGTVKYKRLGATTAQPPSGRPHMPTERDRLVLKRVAHKSSLSSVATLTIELQITSGSKVSTRTVCRELHEMCFHGRAATHMPKITLRKAKRWLVWCKACRHWTQWNSGAVETHSLERWITLHHLSVWQMNMGLIESRRTLPARMHSANYKVWWRRNNGLGLFFMVQARPFSSSEGKS